MSTSKPAAGLPAAITAGQSTAPLEASFAEVIALIEQARQRGFTRRNLFRMRQFYETYRNEAKVTPLVRQLPWTHNMVILTQSKRPEREPGHRVAAVRQQGHEAAEYTLNRTLSPALIAEYQTQLPNKQLLAAKLHEFYALNAPEQASAKPASELAKRTKKAPKRGAKQ